MGAFYTQLTGCYYRRPDLLDNQQTKDFDPMWYYRWPTVSLHYIIVDPASVASGNTFITFVTRGGSKIRAREGLGVWGHTSENVL